VISTTAAVIMHYAFTPPPPIPNKVYIRKFVI